MLSVWSKDSDFDVEPTTSRPIDVAYPIWGMFHFDNEWIIVDLIHI